MLWYPLSHVTPLQNIELQHAKTSQKKHLSTLIYTLLTNCDIVIFFICHYFIFTASRIILKTQVQRREKNS